MPTSRRDFLIRSTGAAAALAALPDRLLADPYAPLPAVGPVAAPVRVRGRVTAAGRPVAGARVSDGVSVVRTAADGTYALIARGDRPFVFVGAPRGFQPRRTAFGTVTFHQRLVPDARGEMTASFTLEPRPDDDRHAFLCLADPQTQDRYETDLLHKETVPDVIETVRTLGARPMFGVGCGDIMFDDLTLYPEWERAVQRMGIPFHAVIGNHDLVFEARTDEGATVTFADHFGPTYHSFDVGRVHYVVLDDVFWHGQGYIGYLEQTQLDWLTNDLATVDKGTPVVVLLHIPALSTLAMRGGARGPNISDSCTNRQALYRALEGYRGYILSGHQHELEHVSDGGVTHVVNGAVCGAWWSGPICYDGTPNGYTIYEADGEAIRWDYKSTGLPREHQMRVYRRGADPTAPDEVVANVWGWAPDWTVTWREDGEPRGVMGRRAGKDPLSVELHAGPDLPARRKWVDPVPTTHLFYAAPSRTAREVTVEARDPWGRTFRGTVRLG
jgi:hypothetical protein